MPGNNSRRQPSGIEKALIIALAVYAVAVVALDTFRPIVDGGTFWPFRWYPIATLGFEADNNGKVITVEKGGPAEAAGLLPDQYIDLASVRPDRRAVNIFVYVAHGSTYAMRVVAGPNAPRDVVIHAADEHVSGWNATALLIAQCSALFFIALCVYLVWHSATWATWGFFLYGMWFNSGQYFVWYANLPTAGLVAFDALQVLAQATALTGFVAFAMHFPEENLPGWTPARRAWLLGGIWLVLLVSGGGGFLNFVLDWRTETPYEVYYAFTFVVYFIAAWFFVHNFRRLPEQRPRMRWIMAAGLVGLPCFLIADSFEATRLARYLPLDPDAQEVLFNFMYAMNVLLPMAVVYTARQREVMSVRFGITRAVVLSTAFVLSAAALDIVGHLPITMFVEQRDALHWLAPILSFALAVVLTLFHNRLHEAVEYVCAPSWHRARRKLEALTRWLTDNDDVTRSDVDDALLRQASTALWLKCAALFRRDAGMFVLEDEYNWPQAATHALCGDDPWVCSTATGPAPLTDPEAAPADPELALPVRCAARHPAGRVVLYGHHVTGERIDPDEIRILNEVSRAAALAYMRLEFEAAADAAAQQAGTA